MTKREVCQAIRAIGLRCQWGEGSFWIEPKGVSRERAEAMAYETSDPDDAIATAKDMARRLGLGR